MLKSACADFAGFQWQKNSTCGLFFIFRVTKILLARQSYSFTPIPAHLKADILRQLEMFSVESEIAQNLRIVHKIWKVFWNREIAVTHHLLGSVNDYRFVNARSARLRVLLK